ncbi:MAG: NAD(P)H-hydrate dehydratase [Muribaculaceae bacterium]|jgi:ADP-dependent NAD(P)H-hydrate dehydratase / NAD(P)H-hydrate epimerase|nr:NAD(P)H-hydrate dehydratase [Muribaculaceae bacterium]
MKIFTTDEIRKIDDYTIEHEEVTVTELIDRAASAVACEIISRWRPNKRFVVFAGPGNNGGDALAVAKILIEQGYKVEVFLFNVPTSHLSKGCNDKRDKLLEIGNVDFKEIVNEFEPPYLSKNDVVIDGLFGTGLKEPLKGGFTSLVQYINESGAFVVSIDVPSGMFGEWNVSNDRRNIVRANLTLAFQFKRLAFFLPENAELVGECKVLDIELSQEAIAATKTDYYLMESHDVKYFLRPRPAFSNKYDFGSGLIVAGSYGMMGAAILTASAAMRAGIGIVSVHSPRCGMTPIQTGVPEAIFDADKHDILTTGIKLQHKYSAIAIGPGIGTNDLTVNALEEFLKNVKQPCILDADALNCIASRPMLLNSIPPMSVLTPHSGEFDRLFGAQLNEEMRLSKAIELAKYYRVIIVLKGHNTMTVRPDGVVYINSTGNQGMATAGSGDVLTGIITAFAAQGYNMELSAAIGVFVHGLAGDMACEEQGAYGMTASDIIAHIGHAIKQIMA